MIGLTVGFIGCVCLIICLFREMNKHEIAIVELLKLHPELLVDEEEEQSELH